jgi:hypothetical protein
MRYIFYRQYCGGSKQIVLQNCGGAGIPVLCEGKDVDTGIRVDASSLDITGKYADNKK